MEVEHGRDDIYRPHARPTRKAAPRFTLLVMPESQEGVSTPACQMARFLGSNGATITKEDQSVMAARSGGAYKGSLSQTRRFYLTRSAPAR